MTRQRLNPHDRKRLILEAAGRVALRAGFHAVTRELVACEAECATGLVSKYFGTVPGLRRALMREAVRQGHASIVADGLALRDPVAKKAPAALLEAARAILATR